MRKIISSNHSSHYISPHHQDISLECRANSKPSKCLGIGNQNKYVALKLII